jgi:uncharacterized protein YcnI
MVLQEMMLLSMLVIMLLTNAAGAAIPLTIDGSAMGATEVLTVQV